MLQVNQCWGASEGALEPSALVAALAATPHRPPPRPGADVICLQEVDAKWYNVQQLSRDLLMQSRHCPGCSRVPALGREPGRTLRGESGAAGAFTGLLGEEYWLPQLTAAGYGGYFSQSATHRRVDLDCDLPSLTLFCSL